MGDEVTSGNEMEALLKDFSALNMELNESKAKIYELTTQNKAYAKELTSVQKQTTQTEKAHVKLVRDKEQDKRAATLVDGMKSSERRWPVEGNTALDAARAAEFFTFRAPGIHFILKLSDDTRRPPK